MQPISSAATPGAQLPSTDSQLSTAQPVDQLANEQTFLQLLVAQIKNQDPLQPTDGVQFLSQLAQFSQLEQLIGIRSELNPTQSQTASQTNNSGQNSNPAVPSSNPAA